MTKNSPIENTAVGLALLRAPFPANQISYLPKGGVKLAYVGHAALTDRLLDADPTWVWEPLAMGDGGLPVMDPIGGMWIKLTVCGVTRLGYGHAGTKVGGDAIKEVIGDALRNAAMRFGAALDLWHKGDLHGDDDGSQAKEPDMTPKSRADRIRVGVAAGDATGAALAMSGWDAPLIESVWALLDAKTQDQLTAAWPK
jgi:hypothetical protein